MPRARPEANPSIRVRLALGLTGLFALLAAVGVAGARTVDRIGGEVRAVEAANAEVARLAEAQSALWQLRWRAAEYLLEPDGASSGADEDDRLLGEVRAALARSAAGADPLVAVARDAVTAYADTRPVLRRLVMSGDVAAATRYRDDVANPAGVAATDAVTAVLDQQHVASEARTASALGAVDDAELTIVVLVVAAVVAGGLLAGFTIGRIGRAERRLAHLARHDPLTGLANRAVLRERLELVAASDGPATLLLVDLDGFKQVNDSLGHDAGDQVLVDVAERFAAVVGDELLVRLGGDEFAVVLASTGRGEALADALAATLASPVELSGVPVRVRASIGIAESPADTAEPTALLQLADAAMYAAKGSGRTWSRPDPAQRAEAHRQLRLATELPAALAGPELELHYQPTVHLGTGELRAVEALMRWRHPELGLLAPGAFLPLVDAAGLDEVLALRVAADALAATRRWRAAGHALAVAVNVSPRTLTRAGFVARLADTLVRAGLPPDALILELTEESFASEAAGGMPGLKEALRAVRSLGIKVAIDDFGSGYSALTYLRDLAVDAVKLDRSFCSGLAPGSAAEAIVAMTVALAHRLGFDVVAEGVEQADVYEHVGALGCDVAQGYWISRPLPEHELLAWLRRWSAERAHVATPAATPAA